jgi:hypothetical protein
LGFLISPILGIRIKTIQLLPNGKVSDRATWLLILARASIQLSNCILGDNDEKITTDHFTRTLYRRRHQVLEWI